MSGRDGVIVGLMGIAIVGAFILDGTWFDRTKDGEEMNMTPAEMREMAASACDKVSDGDVECLNQAPDDLRRHYHAGGRDASAMCARIIRAIPIPETTAAAKYARGDFVQKIRGSKWRGEVVGFYETENTSVGYVVESWFEPGSVQAWPEAALGPWTPPTATAADEALEKAREARDEWERKYNAIVMGADPNASRTAKEYRAAVERACDEALGRYKHEAREAQAALKKAREALGKVQHWARTRCPCENEKPDPCPLCGASVEVAGDCCLAVERTIPATILTSLREALAAIDAAKAKGGG